MASSLVPNTLIGARYRLEKRIGQGGMAEVWLANDISLGRKVAVKMMKSQHNSDPVVIERFRREAQAVANLSHPNIVAVYDVVENDGQQAVVMEYIEGMTLREVLDQKTRLSPSLTIHIGMAIASALDAAHAAGLVHRDIKPGNILITPAGRVMLADFGIAKAVNATEADLTNQNIMMGTAKYLSPEQVRGKPLDGRADIYSLGLVLYECLAGRVPFIGDSDVETALARVQRDPTNLLKKRPNLPPALTNFIHLMLHRDPARRPPTGLHVYQALVQIREAGVDGTPTGLTPASGNTGVYDTHPISPMSGYQQPPIPGEVTFSNPVSRGTTAPTRTKRARIDVSPSTLLAAAMALIVVFAGIFAWRTVTGDETLTTDAPALEPAPTAAAAPAGPVTITRAMSYDPNGDDGVENDELLPLLLDGLPRTQWRTVCYGDKFFGSKGGVGVVLELSAPSAGTLMVNPQTKPWGIEVYSALDVVPATLEQWGPRVAKNYGTEVGATTFVVDDLAKYLLVWFTESGASSACSSKNPFQGVLAGAAFTSSPATP
jgi:serine/threonine-protein kinase